MLRYSPVFVFQWGRRPPLCTSLLCSPSQSGGGCCGLGRMRGGVIQRARSRPGQEGARDISAGWVKKLQGWRSDRTGSRRPRPKHWAKLTGTLPFGVTPSTFSLFYSLVPPVSVCSLCGCFTLTVRLKCPFVEVSSFWSFFHSRTQREGKKNPSNCRYFATNTTDA